MASSIADYLAQVDRAEEEELAAKASEEKTKAQVAVAENSSQLRTTSQGDFVKGEKWETSIEAFQARKKLRKYALLMGYSGQGYSGMQWNPVVDTIESVLFEAMVKAHLIPANFADDMQKLQFQRCARTDKGVSAAGQVVSIPLPVESNAIHTIPERINAHLPPAIRIFGVKRATRGFNSKNWCSARTYLYMCPSFVFAPLEDAITYDYRLPVDRITEANTYFTKYLGSRNYHNFTVAVKPWQDSSKRFMKEVKCSQPFIQDGMELVVITVKGQSFMMHQIRKMVGLVMAVMRGHVTPDIFETIFDSQKADVPRAPGLGLLLQAVHFDMYNDKFAKDGSHDALDWPECEMVIEQFKRDYIFPAMIKGEKEENNMLTWLAHLPNFVFGYREGRTVKNGPSALGDAAYNAEVALASSSEEDGDSDSGEARPFKKKPRHSEDL